MPGAQHILMGRCAYDALPAGEQEFWKGLRDLIANESVAPDHYYSERDKYAPYCIMANGQTIPHGPTDAEWTPVPFVKSPVPASHRYTIEYYLTKLVETIAASRKTDSAMFAAVFGHFLQDSSQPAHAVHNDWLYDLVRRPSDQSRHLHRDLDGADPDETVLRQTKPRLLGTTVSEASFQLRAAYEAMICDTLQKLVPLVSAAYAGDKASMSRAITGPYQTATFLTASAWHTAHCIANERFDQQELEKLRTVHLNRVPYSSGFTVDPCGFRPLIDHDCDGRGNAVPLSLKVGNSSGRAQVREFADGLAMTWGNIVYDIPTGIYREFRAKIGLSSSVPDDSQAIFKVVLDGGPVVYEECQKTIRDYGGHIVFDSELMTGADTANDIPIPLGQTAKITLIVECPAQNTHALWVEPVLIRAD